MPVRDGYGKKTDPTRTTLGSQPSLQHKPLFPRQYVLPVISGRPAGIKEGGRADFDVANNLMEGNGNGEHGPVPRRAVQAV